MPKLLLITGDYPPICKGDANHAFFLARHLARRQIKVEVLTTALTGVPESPGVTVFPLMRRWKWTSLPRLAWFLRQSKPGAILQIFDQKGAMYDFHPMMTFAPTVAKRIIPTVRFVTQFETPHGIRTRDLSIVTRALRKGMKRWSRLGAGYHPYGTLLRDSDHIIVLSKAHQAELANECPRVDQKVSLIPPPPIMAPCAGSPEEARNRGRALLGVTAEEFLFTFFGYVYAGKGMETLLPAFRALTTQFPQARLAVVGGYSRGVPDAPWNTYNQTYWEGIQHLCQNLDLVDRIIWTGRIDPMDERASLYLRATDACVLPFDSGIHLNSSSLSMVMSHELPVIATQATDTEDRFVDGETLRLCPPRDVGALTRAMTAVLTDPALRDRLRRGAAAFAREWFSWDRAIDQTLRILF